MGNPSTLLNNSVLEQQTQTKRLRREKTVYLNQNKIHRSTTECIVRKEAAVCNTRFDVRGDKIVCIFLLRK